MMTPEELLDSMHVSFPDFLRQEVVDPKQRHPRYRYSYKFNNKVALYLSPFFIGKYVKEHNKIKARVQYRIPEYANQPMELEIIITDVKQVWEEISTKLSPAAIKLWVYNLESATRNKAIAEKIARDIHDQYKEYISLKIGMSSSIPIYVSVMPNEKDPSNPLISVRIHTDATQERAHNLIDIFKKWQSEDL
jgi:hypothetical protein